MKITSIITDYIARTILTVNGDLLTRVGGVLTRFGIGTAGQVLRSNSGATAVEWGDPNTIDDVAGTTLKCKIIDIGDWNMVANNAVSIPHGLNKDNIVTISCYIRNDTAGTYYPLFYGHVAALSEVEGNVDYWGSSNIEVRRKTGGDYDGVGFDATSYNRGKLFVWYLA